LEHRRNRTRNRTRSLEKKVVAQDSAVIPMLLPNLAHLITYGEITLGVLRPVGVSPLPPTDITVAMLVRRRGETLAQLLTRLEQAVDKALTEDVYMTKSIPKAVRVPFIP
jgi:hypothetical protein